MFKLLGTAMCSLDGGLRVWLIQSLIVTVVIFLTVDIEFPDMHQVKKFPNGHTKILAFGFCSIMGMILPHL